MKKTIESLMNDSCAEAVPAGKDLGVRLDFSPESIAQVEKALAKLHRHQKKTRKDDQGLEGLALIFGSYIGEVIRRMGFKGRWKRNHKDFGADSFPFHWKFGTLFPYGWCWKRIFTGPPTTSGSSFRGWS